MPHVVAEPCIKCKFTECVAVCPVDCFHEGAEMVVIDPEECIDCGACIDECPAGAIFPQEDLPEEWRHFAAFNAEHAKQWPSITKTQEPLPGADDQKDATGKFEDLDPSPAKRPPEP